ncbi:MAG TPA: type II toxin-antitoxin system death-on-curing family toxin [Beijerinckiaceae bacterium]
MSDPVWVETDVVLAIHDEQLSEHGGLPGVRDMGLLRSALDRPRNLFAYEGADLIGLAAAYGFGIARNHPFNDGNKRVSAVVTEVFLALNGLELTASDDDVVATWLALAAGAIDESQFGTWLRDNVS